MLHFSRTSITRRYSRLLTSLVSGNPTLVSKTSNGIRVATESLPGETATIGVWIDAGSRYENELNNGVACFLEHMSFKGTNSRTQVQLETEIENIGGHLTAYTSREQTAYHAKVFKSDVPKAVAIFSDIIQNSLLNDDAVSREREVILREMQKANKTYDEIVLNHLHETAFMGTGLGRTVLGPEQNIRKLTKADLTTFMNTHYTADRFVIAGAGAVDHEEIVKLSEQHFGNLAQSSKKAVGEIFEPAIFTGSDKRIRYDSMGVAHVAIAFEGASWTSEYAFPLMMIQTMLGSWDRSSPIGRNAASKLAREVSEHELAHSFMAFNTSYKDTGLIGVYLVCPDNKLNDVMWYTLDNMVRFCHSVTEEEIQRAKTQLKVNVLTRLESFSQIAEDIGRQMLNYGRRMTTEEIFARIDAISIADIKSTANKFINDEDHVLAAIGPIFELPDYNFIRRRSYWHRY